MLFALAEGRGYPPTFTARGVERLGLAGIDDLAKGRRRGPRTAGIGGMVVPLGRCATRLLREFRTVVAARRIGDLTASVPYLVFDLEGEG